MDYIKGISLLIAPIVCVILLFLAAMGIDKGLDAQLGPMVCTEKSKIKEITSLRYRSATVLLENGQSVDAYQATLKPGDYWCLKRERVKVGE
jgi:hypothetical protein